MLPKEIIEFIKKKVKEEVDGQLEELHDELIVLKDKNEELKVEINILKEGGNI